MEYLISGKPVLMFKLDCIPKEYEDYIYFIDENNTESISRSIIEILSKSNFELNEFGEKARNFIIKNKSNKTQVAKVFNMLNKID
jgi:glycosyltransferase involved in cell wall biosynthesis